MDRQNGKTIISNFFSLGLLQGVNCLIPVLVIPFIVRALGVEVFGKVSFAQSVVQYFTILVTYGFDYSATKEIAIHREERNRTASIFWGVISAKFTLFILACFAFSLLSIGYGRIREDYLLYGSLFAVNIGYVLFPTWFFQGIENMRVVALINFIIKLIGTGLPVFLVAAPEDYLIYAAMPSAAYALMGVIAFVYAIRKYGIVKPSSDKIRIERNNQMKKGFPVFLNTLFAALYTVANLTILGLLTDDYEVGIYSGAYKIIGAIMMVTSMPLHMSIFPSVTRRMEHSATEGWRYFKRVMLYVFLFAIVVSLFVYFTSPLMVNVLLGEKFIDSIFLLRLLSVIPALVILASMFTVQGLYGLGFEKYAPWVGLSVGIFCIMLNFAWIPMMGCKGAALAWILAEVLEIAISATIVFVNVQKLNK